MLLHAHQPYNRAVHILVMSIDHTDPWQVLIRTMEAHSQEADHPEPLSVKDNRFLHLDAAADCAKAALPYKMQKAEGAQIDDPTAELEEMRRIIAGLPSVAVGKVMEYLRMKADED